MFFTSDNASGVAPQVMAALAKANEGYEKSYGTDAIMDRVRAQIRAIFEAPEAAVYLVVNGTTANSLALSIGCPPWGAVFCHQAAHINVDECSAPEFFTNGAKLIGLAGPHGKITPQSLAQGIATTGQGGVHGVQRALLSLTNVTEAGTVYTPAEVGALTTLAHADGQICHMDGARFANALVTTKATPAEMTWKSGIDILSFGGTKNGLMGVEAVVIFDPAKAWEFELRRKRSGHLISKHRFLSAQMEAYLDGGLWLHLAAQANAMASRLSRGITSLPGVTLTHPTEANIVFASWPRAGHNRARMAGATYHFWPSDPPTDGPADEPLPARLVTSWCTTESDVDTFLSSLKGQ